MAQRVPAGLSPAEGRKFAFTVGGAFAVLAAVATWRGHPTTTLVLGSLAGVLGVLGAVVPGRLGPLQAAWMGLAHAISKVTTPIFMGVVYFVVITPISLVMALLGKRPLRAPAGATTYWVDRAPEARQSDLTRQF